MLYVINACYINILLYLINIYITILFYLYILVSAPGIHGLKKRPGPQKEGLYNMTEFYESEIEGPGLEI